MATQTKTDPIETATARVAEFNEKAVENSKTAGAAYLDSYEKAVAQIADGYEKAAGATKIEWLVDGRRDAGRLRPRDHQGLHGRRARARRPLAPTSPPPQDPEPRRLEHPEAPRLDSFLVRAPRGDERLVDLDQRAALIGAEVLVGADRGDHRRLLARRRPPPRAGAPDGA